MSILIKGMKMPQDCIDCQFEHYNRCQLEGGVGGRVEPIGRPSDCPLIHIPDHGDLIEKRPIVDALAVAQKNVSAIQRGAETKEDIRYCQGVIVGYANSILVINNAPVVIPAERSEE